MSEFNSWQPPDSHNDDQASSSRVPVPETGYTVPGITDLTRQYLKRTRDDNISTALNLLITTISAGGLGYFVRYMSENLNYPANPLARIGLVILSSIVGGAPFVWVEARSEIDRRRLARDRARREFSQGVDLK